MDKETKSKLIKKTIFTFIYTFIWMFALSLLLQFLQALNVLPRVIGASYIYIMAIGLALAITYLRMKKFVKTPKLLDQ